ncbi:Mitochondrial 2-oxodicarboxylate carrier [Trichostrongylus colubriformis]|uniref:Mitochondrial 2-oxodicarboxylate carrier n=1 Tax=Trichostrongylus colubriformis TaxID=6319 RepID=A0AAN8F891_TRICO
MVANAAKDGARQLIAGGSAGFVEVCMLHPLDLVKTRLQVAQHDKGMIDCVLKTFRNEGYLGFYKGILPPLVSLTPKRAVKFFAFEQYKKLFSRPDVPPSISFSVAGLFVGFTEGLVMCPFEVVKVRLQAEREVPLMKQKSSAAMAREIIRADGMGSNGLYRGFNACFWMHGVWNMVYFGFYYSLKTMLPSAEVCISSVSIFFTPFIEREGPQPDPSVRKYGSTMQTFELVYKEEGLGALYKGLVPKVMRLGPGGAIMLVVYEHVYDWLKIYT